MNNWTPPSILLLWQSCYEMLAHVQGVMQDGEMV